MDEKKQELTTISFTLPPDLKIQARARKVIALRFEHPDWTYMQLAHAVGLSHQRIAFILNHPRVLAAMPLIARQRIAGMVPKASKRLTELMEQNVNLEVSRKVTERVLTEKKVLDVPETKVVAEITLKTVDELRKMVQEAASVPQTVIEAELVDEKRTPAIQDTTQE